MPRGQIRKTVVRAVKKAAKTVYRGAQKHVPKGTMANIGRSIGAAYGAPDVGRAMGQQFANLTGVGSYSAVPRGRSIMPRSSYQPLMKTVNSDEDLVVSRREYVMDLQAPVNTSSPTPFYLEAKKLNPGLDAENGGIFSWLPQVAAGFSSYSIEQMVVQYVSSSGDATGANTALGSVFLAANYLSSDTPPINKEDCLNSQYSVSGPPSRNLTFPLECRKSTKNMKNQYVRTGPVQAGQNVDMFDYATIYFGTEGIQTAGQTLGEIYVTYTIRFTKFKTINKANQNRFFKAVWFGTAGSGPTTSWPFGQLTPQGRPQPNPRNTLSMFVNPGTGGTATTLQFPNDLVTGTFFVYLRWRFSSTRVNSFNTSQIAFQNCFVVTNGWLASNSPNNAAISDFAYLVNPGTVTEHFFSFQITVTGPNAGIIFEPTFWGTTLGANDCTDSCIHVHELNPYEANQDFSFY